MIGMAVSLLSALFFVYLIVRRFTVGAEARGSVYTFRYWCSSSSVWRSLALVCSANMSDAFMRKCARGRATSSRRFLEQDADSQQGHAGFGHVPAGHGSFLTVTSAVVFAYSGQAAHRDQCGGIRIQRSRTALCTRAVGPRGRAFRCCSATLMIPAKTSGLAVSVNWLKHMG